jgi:hypothetical protein
LSEWLSGCRLVTFVVAENPTLQAPRSLRNLYACKVG